MAEVINKADLARALQTRREAVEKTALSKPLREYETGYANGLTYAITMAQRLAKNGGENAQI